MGLIGELELKFKGILFLVRMYGMRDDSWVDWDECSISDLGVCNVRLCFKMYDD